MTDKRKRVDDSAKPDTTYDTYIFVGEEQPFRIYRIDTTQPDAETVRTLVQKRKDEQGDDAVQFFILLERYIENGEFDGDEDDEDDKEDVEAIRAAVRDRSLFENKFENEWTPIHMDWKNANVYLLNTWH